MDSADASVTRCGMHDQAGLIFIFVEVFCVLRGFCMLEIERLTLMHIEMPA